MNISGSEELIRMVLKNFYSDSHNIIFELIYSARYVSSSTISQRLLITLDKVKAITSSLFNENFIKFQDRIFRKTGQDCDFMDKSTKKKKVYKLRYWFVDPNQSVLSIKKKLSHVIREKLDLEKKTGENIFKCSRKSCNSTYTLNDVVYLKYDSTIKSFMCSRLVSPKVICGSKLVENKGSSENFMDDLDDEISPELVKYIHD